MTSNEGKPLVCCCVTPAVYRQILTAIFCCISSMSVGISLGWAAPAFIKIKNGETNFQLSIYGQSFVVSALNIGLMCSTFPAGYCMDRFGRKRTLLCFSVFSLLNWLLVSVGTTAPILFLARFFAGIFTGCVITVGPVYITECVETRIRGYLASQHTVFMNAGILLAFLIGPQVGYEDFAVICGAFTVLFIVAFSLPPESPYYLAMKKNPEGVRKSLSWLRATNDVEQELKSVTAFVESSTNVSCRFKDLFTNPTYRRPFLVSMTLLCLQKFTGYFTLLAYQTVILPKKLGVLTSENCTQISGVIILLSTFLASHLMDIAGRRILLFVCHTGISIFMGILGVLFLLNSTKHIDVGDYSYLLVLSFVGYVFSYSIGVGPIAPLYIGEVLPQAAKGTAGPSIALMSSIASAGNTFVFAVTASYVGMHWNFFCFAGFSVLSLFFTYFFIAETKNRDFQDIQEAFKHKNASKA